MLLDLNKIDDAELKRKTWAGVMELAMKHIFAKDMLPYLKEKQGMQQERERFAMYLIEKNEEQDLTNIAELTKLPLEKIKELKQRQNLH